MKLIHWTTTGLAALTLSLAACTESAPPPTKTLVPRPLSVETTDGAFHFGPQTVLAIPDEAQRPIAEAFASLFTQTAGFTPSVKTGQEGDIVLTPDTTLKAEAYTLCITPKRIDITAADTRGYFYALQSLRQMLPPAIEGNTQKEEDWSIPAVTKTRKRKKIGAYRLLPSRTNPASATEAICWTWPAISCPRKTCCV